MSFRRVYLKQAALSLRSLRETCCAFGRIPVIFAIFFSAMIVCGSVMAPPFQTPDEYAHFLRNVQISEGHITGQKNGAESGGYILDSANKLTALFTDMIFRTSRKATIPEIQSYNAIGWGSPKVFASFPNTVLYGPVLYLPSSITIFITRHLVLPVLQSYYIARFVNALAYLLLSIVALSIARRGRVFLCIILSLPMAVSLANSVSQDGPLIAVSAVLAAILTNHREETPWSWLQWAAMGVGFGLLGMAKLPYVALSGMACLLAVRREILPSLACPIVAVILTFAWMKFGIAPVRVHLSPHPGVSETGQSLFVTHHPMEFLRIVMFTISEQWNMMTEQFMGILGWLNVELPQYFYSIGRVALALILALGFAFRALAEVYRKNLLFFLRAFLLLLLMAAVILAIYLSLYLIWSVVGAPIVDGIQGRYFLPMILFLAVLLPDFRDTDLPPLKAVIKTSSAVLCTGWLGLSTFIFFQAILMRFWMT